MDEESPSIKKLREIKDDGIKAAQLSIDKALSTQQDEFAFGYLIAKAQERERKVLANLAPEYRDMIEAKGELNLNEIISEIDERYNFKELLANRGVEIYLKQNGYSLEAKGSKTEQNKSDEEKASSLVLPLPEREQQQVLNHITERFKQEIVSNIIIEGNNVRQLYRPLIDAAAPYFQQLLSSHVSATGLSLNNIDFFVYSVTSLYVLFTLT